VNRRRLRALTKRLLQSEGKSPAAEVSLLLCNDSLIRELNGRYRGIDSATDVLSFPQDAPRLLGDVVISVETAERQASEYGVTVQEEVERLLAHGVLHLLGYDHESETEAEVMQAKEEALFAAEQGHEAQALHR